jgi:hypothetical protein
MHSPIQHQLYIIICYLKSICNRCKDESFLTARRLVIGQLAVIFFLSGCAGQHAFEESQALLASGKTEEGFAKMDEAIKLDPKNTDSFSK